LGGLARSDGGEVYEKVFRIIPRSEILLNSDNYGRERIRIHDHFNSGAALDTVPLDHRDSF